jgi:hypothetical protein
LPAFSLTLPETARRPRTADGQFQSNKMQMTQLGNVMRPHTQWTNRSVAGDRHTNGGGAWGATGGECNECLTAPSMNASIACTRAAVVPIACTRAAAPHTY